RQRSAALLGAVISHSGLWPMARFVLARLAAIFVWAALSFIVAILGVVLLRWALPSIGPIRIVLAVIVVGALVRGIPMLLVRSGRGRLRADWDRLVHHEYWPAWVFYLPLVPYITYLVIKHRGLTVLTSCNPGIENGGGLIGESKHAIMQK